MSIVWRPGMSIGIAELDDDHRTFVTHVNTLERLVTAPGFAASDALLMVDKLRAYTRQHFAREEQAMAALRHPRAGDHAALHRQGLARLERVARALDAAPTRENAWAVYRFAAEWLMRHILVADRDIASHAPPLAPAAALATAAAPPAPERAP